MSAEQRLAEVEQQLVRVMAALDASRAREESLKLGTLREQHQQRPREPEGVQGTQRRTHADDTRQRIRARMRYPMPCKLVFA
eukprot:1086373-Amphidinium_carterae.1